MRSRLLPTIDPLEPRRHLAVNFAIDASADVHPISRYIYGTNYGLTGAFANATLTRLGGNRWTAYNWENNASNAGSDYQFQNDGFLSGSNVPGAAVAPTIANAFARKAATMLTIPIAGYASADKNGGGDVRGSGANYLSTRFNQIVARKGAAFSLTPDVNDDFVYTDEFVNWVKQTYPAATTDPLTPIWFSIDNEPDLWADTHAEIHSTKVTYAELIARTIDHAKAIKDVMPATKVFGPASYGYGGYTNLQSAVDANGRDFLETYLKAMNDASVADGRRLLDVLDLHWYPEARGGGVRITEANTSAGAVAARLQAPRSLWDATYKEDSWIANDVLNGPIKLLPRLQAKIDAKYPGTPLGFSEYNYGGGAHISGGIAQADVLGIFGRHSVFSANQWALSGNEPFVGGAFQMYRDYDGAGSAFGDTSIRATSSDVAGTSVYASVDSKDPNVMVVIAINKTAAANQANLSLAGRTASGAGKAYQLTAGSASPQAAGNVAIGNGSAFSYTMPAYSVTTLRIPLNAVGGPAPKVQSSSFRFESSPNAVRFTFDRDVSASLSTADLTVSRGFTPVTPTGVSYDASTNTATFTLPTNLPDGDYTATLAGSGVSAGGTAMGQDSSVTFHVLLGDADRDRDVDFDDLLIVARNYGQSSRTFSQGNFDYSNDGLVNFDDLLIVARRYGTSLTPVAGLNL